MSGAVTIDIEFHNSNAFHTSYNCGKYLELARRLELHLKSCLGTEGIEHSVRLNHGPGKGYERAGGHNWFRNSRDGKWRQYPRLGCFEVVLSCPSGLVPPSAGLPPRLEVWSKLASRRWPDPEELAQSVMELLTAALNSETVSDMVKTFKGLCTAIKGQSSNAPKAPMKPPMFFGLRTRDNFPGIIEIRKTALEQCAEEERKKADESLPQSFSIPRRPASAGASRSAALTPGRIRPKSAGTSRSLQASYPGREIARHDAYDLEQKVCLASPAESPVSKKDELPSGDSLDEHRFQGLKSSLANEERLQQLESSAEATDAMISRPELEELTRMLLKEYGSSVDLDTLIEGDATVMLDADEFKEQLYALRIINSPFNYIGLFKEICNEGDRASIANLLDSISDCWPTPAVRGTRRKEAAPGVKASPPLPPPRPGSAAAPPPPPAAAKAKAAPPPPALPAEEDQERPESPHAGFSVQVVPSKTPTPASPGPVLASNGSVQNRSMVQQPAQQLASRAVEEDPYDESFEPDDNQTLSVQRGDPEHRGQHSFDNGEDTYDDIVPDRIIEGGQEFDYAEDVEEGSGCFQA
eukprot:TRINITY_DN5232_c0_g1_i1.p1 TRINITY_DN5232_c0_g1~~TRINITY_DN5232_c0_g1_i1.p1  ORF type:complete len:582 (-),score=127.61 TRINITY_DN5232_c0_g1_i1:86-1831(-)